MSFGHMPAGYNGEGSQGSQLNQQNMTSCAHSSWRNSQAQQLRCPLDSVVHGMGSLGFKGRTWSPFAICCSKLMFPWMNPRSTDTKESGALGGVRLGLPSEAGGSVRRERTAFTGGQLLELEKEFHFSPYLSRTRRLDMAQGLSLTDRQIKIWFQNRRMRYKKEHKDRAHRVRHANASLGAASSSSVLGTPSSSSSLPPYLDYDGGAPLAAHSDAISSYYLHVNPADLPPPDGPAPSVADGSQSYPADRSHQGTPRRGPGPNHLPACVYSHHTLLERSSLTYM